jgi:hypothetical protein
MCKTENKWCDAHGGGLDKRQTQMVQFLWQDYLLSVARFIADCFDHFQSGGDPS